MDQPDYWQTSVNLESRARLDEPARANKLPLVSGVSSFCTDGARVTCVSRQTLFYTRNK